MINERALRHVWRWLLIAGFSGCASGEPDFGEREAEIGVTLAPLTRADITARWPHIEVLGPGDEQAVWPGMIRGKPSIPRPTPAPARLVEPTEAQLESVGRTLAMAPLRLRDTVKRIAFARWEDESLEGSRLGGRTGAADIVLNADYRRGRSPLPAHERTRDYVLLHELAHAVAFSIDLESKAEAGDTSASVIDPLESYSAADRQRAANDIRKYMLQDGLSAHWQRLHESGIALGKTQPYRKIVQADEVFIGGFATQYGGTNPADDIAEFVASTLLPTSEWAGYCPSFAGNTQLMPETAIPYAKLLLLRSLDMITQAAFDACVQGAAPRHQPGFRFAAFASTDNIKAGLATTAGLPFFRFMTSGPGQYAFMLDLRLAKQGQSPVGLHRLQMVPPANNDRFYGSAFYMVHPNVDLTRTAVAGALVLVSNYATDNAAGVIFDMVLEDAFGGQWGERAPYTTFSTP